MRRPVGISCPEMNQDEVVARDGIFVQDAEWKAVRELWYPTVMLIWCSCNIFAIDALPTDGLSDIPTSEMMAKTRPPCSVVVLCERRFLEGPAPTIEGRNHEPRPYLIPKR